MADRGPVATCSKKHQSNSTLEYHECMCMYDYSYARSSIKKLKIYHCNEMAEIHKMGSFYTYIVVAAVFVVALVVCVAGVCSFKWYLETKKNPCSCCPLFCCCKKRKRSKHITPNSFEQCENGHTWSPVNLPPSRENDIVDCSQPTDPNDSSMCMDFCLSDPVQDCCEFFDCDIMWRKKSVYTIPIFGRKKQQHFHRRPTRPAPLPPKAVVLPQIKNSEPIIEGECEPVPEAPPSPEPIRTLPAKAMYVDPLAFLQRTFNKNTQVEKENDDNNESKEPLYSKIKNMVLSKVKKSASTASIDKIGETKSTKYVSSNPSGSGYNSKKKTASLASLNNLGDAELNCSYGSKRSLSLASLHMLQEQGVLDDNLAIDPQTGAVMLPGHRDSMLSTNSSVVDDIPPAARKDEYIDLAEMSKRIEAKMQAARSLATSPVNISVHGDYVSISSINPQKPHSSYTPNFIPASAFIPPQNASFSPVGMQPSQTDSVDYRNQPQTVYYHSGSSSQGRPTIPPRTIAGSTAVPSSSKSTPSKPVVPPRPHLKRGDFSRDSSSSQSSTLSRSSRVVKPTGPPPPPPGKPPIESSI